MTKDEENVNIESLNNRDLLLLSQIVEQNGGICLEDEDYSSELEIIHQQFTTHPVFLLSHNELHETQLEISQEQLGEIIEELKQLHGDKTIVQICEFYYQKRIKELESSIHTLETQFGEVKKRAAAQKWQQKKVTAVNSSDPSFDHGVKAL